MGRGFESLQARWDSPESRNANMVGMAQLVSAPDCGSGDPGFEPLYPPEERAPERVLFYCESSAYDVLNELKQNGGVLHGKKEA